jgi:hypothetical protein
VPKRTSMKGMGADAFFQSSASPQSNVGKPVSQQASEEGIPLVKATFYLTPEHIMTLEQVRLKRKQRGEKVDKSALVREAINHLTGELANQ